MSIKISKNLNDAVDIIERGGIVVTKTDTIYGIITDAFNPESVEKIYRIKGREKDKPFIILIPDIKCLNRFNVNLDERLGKLISSRGITVILKLKEPDKFEYLHRGTKKLGFRIPDDVEFLSFLKKLNIPVVAPSANPSGLEPAKNIKQAIEYFKESVDLYVDRGDVINNVASTIVEMENGKIKIVRQGSKVL